HENKTKRQQQSMLEFEPRNESSEFFIDNEIVGHPENGFCHQAEDENLENGEPEQNTAHLQTQTRGEEQPTGKERSDQSGNKIHHEGSAIEDEAQMTPSVSKRSQLRLARMTFVVANVFFGEEKLGFARMNDHFAGEFHSR